MTLYSIIVLSTETVLLQFVVTVTMQNVDP